MLVQPVISLPRKWRPLGGNVLAGAWEPGMVVGKRRMQQQGNQCQSRAAVPWGTIRCRSHLGTELPDSRVLALKLSVF